MEETDDQQEEYASRGRDNYEDGEGRSENNGNEGITNLYIKQLTPETTEEQLRAAFEKFGEITSCSIILEPVTKVGRGFGFVAFKTVAESDRAIEEMNGAEINGRAITVERARRMGGHAKTPGRYLGPAQLRRGFQDDRSRGRDNGRGPPPREDRYDRDYRDNRDYARGPPPSRSYRDYDRDYPARGPPPGDFDRRGPPPDYRDSRGPPPEYRGPPPGYREDYDRRRPPPPAYDYDYADRRGPPPRDDRREYDQGRPPTRY